MNKKQIKTFVSNSKGFANLNGMMQKYNNQHNSSLPKDTSFYNVKHPIVCPKIIVHIRNDLDFDLVIEGLMN